MPSNRTLVGLGSLIAVVGFSGVAAAQSPSAAAEFGLPSRIGLRFVGAFIVSLIIGGAAAVLGPKYTTSAVREIQDDPGSAFGWGFIVGVLVPIGLVLIGLTGIGLLVTIPGLLFIIVLELIGTGVTVVWLGNTVAGTRSGSVGGKDALIGGLVYAIPAAVPIVGQLFTHLITWFGLGVVGRGVYENWSD